MNENQQAETSYVEEERKIIEYKKKVEIYEKILHKIRENHKDISIEIDNEMEKDLINFEDSKITEETAGTLSTSLLNKDLESNMDFKMNENIEKGLQRISFQLMSSNNNLKPINDLISEDLKNNDRVAIIFEKAKSIILNLSIQVFRFSFFF